jgi:AraC-like DNA-binding protein
MQDLTPTGVGYRARRLEAGRGRSPGAAGYGPKTLQRVLRFRRFLAGPRDDLARAALEAGYADQPHLTREVARLAGTTPSRLIHR